MSVQVQVQVPARRPACTHMRMTRLYGCYQCRICHRVPRRGWVYQCTQDHADFDGISGTGSMLRDSVYAQTDEELAHLYTADQLETIRAQRQKVLDVIANEFADTDSNRSDATTDVLSDPQEASDGDDKENHHTRDVIKLMADGTFTFQTVSAPPKDFFQWGLLRCSFVCCHACRPPFHERAWVPLAAVAHDDFLPTTLSKMENLPISNRDVVIKLGLSTPPGLERRRTFSRSMLPWRVKGAEEVREPMWKQFSKAVHGALEDVMHQPRSSSLGAATSINAGHQRYRLFPLQTRHDGSDLGLEVLPDDEEMADDDDHIEEHLPNEVQGTHGLDFDRDPMDVDGGIAVTEEAITQRAADIITAS